MSYISKQINITMSNKLGKGTKQLSTKKTKKLERN